MSDDEREVSHHLVGDSRKIANIFTAIAEALAVALAPGADDHSFYQGRDMFRAAEARIVEIQDPGLRDSMETQVRLIGRVFYTAEVLRATVGELKVGQPSDPPDERLTHPVIPAPSGGGSSS